MEQNRKHKKAIGSRGRHGKQHEATESTRKNMKAPQSNRKRQRATEKTPEAVRSNREHGKPTERNAEQRKAMKCDKNYIQGAPGINSNQQNGKESIRDQEKTTGSN